MIHLQALGFERIECWLFSVVEELSRFLPTGNMIEELFQKSSIFTYQQTILVDVFAQIQKDQRNSMIRLITVCI